MRTALPVERTSLVGRGVEIARARQLLASGVRLLTLTGTGGVGKTRLAERIAHQTRSWLGGEVEVRWLSLAELERTATREQLDDLLSQALTDVQFRAGAKWDAILRRLEGRQWVIVVDNCEHVIEQASALVTDLVDTAADVQVIATSRAVLAAEGQHLLLVPALSHPPRGSTASVQIRVREDGREHTAAHSDSDGGGQWESVQLLHARVEALGRTISDSDEPLVRQIAAELAGNPLALEMAAQAFMGYSISDIARMSANARDQMNRLKFRTSQPRRGAATTIHGSLYDCMKWSYDLCAPQERRLWRRLSVFSSSFDLAAAEAICADPAPLPDEDAVAEDSVEELLQGLIDHQVVSVDPASSHTTRYRLVNPSIRAFGLVQPELVAEERDVRRRHCFYYRDQSMRAAELWPTDELRFLRWAAEEMPNTGSAMDYASEDPACAVSGLIIAISLATLRSWFFAGSLATCLDRLVQMLHATAGLTIDDGQGELRDTAMAMAAWTALCMGEPAVADRWLGELHVDEIDDLLSLPASALFATGVREMLIRRSPRAIEVFAAARRASEAQRHEADDSPPSGPELMSGLFEALSATWFGDDKTALEVTERVDHETRATTAPWASSWTAIARCIALMHCSRPEEALELARAVLARQVPMDDGWGAMWCVHVIAWALATILRSRMGADADRDRSDATYIARILGGALTQRMHTGVTIDYLGPFQDETALAETTARDVLGDTAFVAAFDEGRTISYGNVFQIALTVWPSLTDDQQRLATQITRGMTNSQIAASEYVSERTVERHVTALLRALGVTTRQEVAPFVPSHGIVAPTDRSR